MAPVLSFVPVYDTAEDSPAKPMSLHTFHTPLIGYLDDDIVRALC